MSKEPFFVNDIVHAFNRGHRGAPIVPDDYDKDYFLQALYYLNNKRSLYKPMEKARGCVYLLDTKFDLQSELPWPSEWPPREPLVKILAFIIKDNHYHFMLQEIQEGGVSEFMRKISNSITGYFNKKYDENGRLFQGSYNARRVADDNYLRYLNAYIHIKNALELYHGDENDFNSIYKFILSYKYSSFRGYVEKKPTLIDQIIDKEFLSEMFKRPNDFKLFTKQCMERLQFDYNKNELLY